MIEGPTGQVEDMDLQGQGSEGFGGGPRGAEKYERAGKKRKSPNHCEGKSRVLESYVPRGDGTGLPGALACGLRVHTLQLVPRAEDSFALEPSLCPTAHQAWGSWREGTSWSWV